jgi:hypothetical protein
MTKSQLIAWSAVRDALDLTPVGHIPLLDQLLDMPIIVMHFKYAGPKAFAVLPELVPFVGVLPVFTIMALMYPANPQRELAAGTTLQRVSAPSQLPLP